MELDEKSIMEKIQRIATDIQDGRRTPQAGANSIYFLAANSGAFEANRDNLAKVAACGSEFEQMADALERNWDREEQRSKYETLIMDAAAAVLSGAPLPEWRTDEKGRLLRDVER